MIVTVDGPAAAGKSTVAKALARRLGFDYLDTGAMYRAATWKALDEGVDMEEPEQVAQAAAQARIDFEMSEEGVRVLCNGQDVTERIRLPQVTASIYRVADLPAARAALIDQQRRLALERDLVTEGRDQGTDVFPDTDFKFYLDASLQERAERRCADLVRMGAEPTLEEVRERLAARDAQDRARAVGSLRLSEDMIVIDSTCLSVEQVVSKMAEIIAPRVEAEHADRESGAQ